MKGAAHMAMLSCAAAEQNWESWDHHIGQAITILDETGFIDRDVAWLAHLAGDLAQHQRMEETILLLFR